MIIQIKSDIKDCAKVLSHYGIETSNSHGDTVLIGNRYMHMYNWSRTYNKEYNVFVHVFTLKEITQ